MAIATPQDLGRTILGEMPHLQWLDVSHNRLEEIEFDTFKGVQHLQVVMAIANLYGKLLKEPGFPQLSI